VARAADPGADHQATCITCATANGNSGGTDHEDSANGSPGDTDADPEDRDSRGVEGGDSGGNADDSCGNGDHGSNGNDNNNGDNGAPGGGDREPSEHASGNSGDGPGDSSSGDDDDDDDDGAGSTGALLHLAPLDHLVRDPAAPPETGANNGSIQAYMVTPIPQSRPKDARTTENSGNLQESTPGGWQENQTYVKSPLEGHFKVMALNCGGKVQPWTKAGTYNDQNRLHTMTKLSQEGAADIILAVGAHITGDETHPIQRFAQEEGCFAATAPTSKLMSRILEHAGSQHQRSDPAAGIIAVMSTAMKSRLRGYPVKAISGRLLHLTFGHGANPIDDAARTHVIACYGISGGSSSRASMAESLYQELDRILSNEDYRRRGDHFIVYADVNSISHGGDRSRGEIHNYDNHEHALWRVLQGKAHNLQDLMSMAYSIPPMTYIPQGDPTSRIDVLFASEAIATKAHAATSRQTGSLSATHLVLACSFADQAMASAAQEHTSEDALNSAVAIMATSGGRRWTLGAANSKGARHYREVAFTDPKIRRQLQDAYKRLHVSRELAPIHRQLSPKTHAQTPNGRSPTHPWTLIQNYLGEPVSEPVNANADFCAELMTIILQAEEMTHNHLKAAAATHLHKTLNSRNPHKPKPGLQRLALTVDELLRAHREGNTNETAIATLAQHYELSPYTGAPPEDLRNREDIEMWLKRVQQWANSNLASKGLHNNSSPTGHAYKSQPTGTGRPEGKNVRNHMAAAKKQVGGMIDGLDVGDGIITCKDALEEHIRSHQKTSPTIRTGCQQHSRESCS